MGYTREVYSLAVLGPAQLRGVSRGLESIYTVIVNLFFSVTRVSHQPLLTRLCVSSDQEIFCACITCHVRCPNDVALRKHGQKQGHRPFGCVCGDTFTRLDVLERHVASKNKDSKFPCPLCEHDETPKAFSRADHLTQHFRTFHKISAGRIPDDFGAANCSHHGPAEDPIHPQPMPRFPCPVPGCTKTGELAYLCQIHLDEHMVWAHQNELPIQQELSGPVSAWTNNGFRQNAHLQTAHFFGQDARQNYMLQPDPIGNSLAERRFLGEEMFVGNTGFQPHDEPNIGFAIDYGLRLDSRREGNTLWRYPANGPN